MKAWRVRGFCALGALVATEWAETKEEADELAALMRTRDEHSEFNDIVKVTCSPSQ